MACHTDKCSCKLLVFLLTEFSAVSIFLSENKTQFWPPLPAVCHAFLTSLSFILTASTERVTSSGADHTEICRQKRVTSKKKCFPFLSMYESWNIKLFGGGHGITVRVYITFSQSRNKIQWKQTNANILVVSVALRELARGFLAIL